MYVTFSDFPLATKTALEFYYQKKLAYDCMYLIGDTTETKVGNFSTGRLEQKNKPHYIELITALAAFNFFGLDTNGTAKERFYYAGNKEEATGVTWKSLPIYNDDGYYSQSDFSLGHLLKQEVVTFAAFSMVMSTYGKSFIGNLDHEANGTPWFRQNFDCDPKKSADDAKNPRNGISKERLMAMFSYCQHYLNWLWHISQEDRVKLFESRASAIGKSNSPDDFDEIEITDVEKEKLKFGCLLAAKQDNKGFTDFVNILNNNLKVKSDKSPHNKLMGLFYAAASIFCNNNYTWTD
jgi:hypothetical protein